MRLALYILASYTLILSCIPCQDEPARVSYKDTITIINASADCQDQGIIDPCSPFCICACCSGITLQKQVALLPEAASLPFNNDDAFAFMASSESGDLASIWQPPRI